MEDIGDLLFYILAGLFAIIGAISRSKKGKAKMFPQEVTTGLPSSGIPGDRSSQGEEYIPELDEESYDWDDTVVSDYSDPVTVVKGMESRETFLSAPSIEGSYMDSMISSVPDEGISSLEISGIESDFANSQDEISSGIMPGEDAEVSLAGEIAKRFSLPEAIVWSEILNRKDHF